MRFEDWRESLRDRVLAIVLGVVVAAVAFWISPGVIDFRAWQPLCEGALLRPPELFQSGLYRLGVYVLTRFCGLDITVKVLRLAGPVALGVIAYHAMLLSLSVLTMLLRVDRIRSEFRTVMMPVLTAVGMGFFLLSWPVLHSAWLLTPSLLTLVLAFLIAGAFRNLFVKSQVAWGYWGVFLSGVLSADSVIGLVLAFGAILVGVRIVLRDGDGHFVLSQPTVYHVAKWTFTILYLLGLGLTLFANAWFFGSHGGMWSEAFRGYWSMPALNALAVMTGLVVAPLLVTLKMIPSSSDNEIYLPYMNGLILLLMALISVSFCLTPEVVAIENECVRALMLYASSLTIVAALMTLMVEVYCRVQAHYPKLARMIVFRLLVAVLLLLVAFAVWLDGSRKIAVAIDRAADEIVRESTGMKRLFSDGAVDGLVELKSALAGERLTVHSMFAGRGEYAARLRTRDVSGDDDLSMMRIGASVALGSWVATDSPELAYTAVQLGLEMWKRAEKPAPKAGGLVILPGGGTESALAEAHAWADDFSDRILNGEYDWSYARCREKRLREAFDMVKWRVGRMLEQRSAECEVTGNLAEARILRRKSGQLDRQNRSLIHLRGFMNLMWNQDTMQLTPRESLKVALGRGNFRAARPHAEAILSNDPDDVPANFALGMYHYVMRNFARAEGYLAKAGELRPSDAAILNNLALVRMYLNKLESAEQLALKALELKPGIKEIQDTLTEVRRRIGLQHAPQK